MAIHNQIYSEPTLMKVSSIINSVIRLYEQKLNSGSLFLISLIIGSSLLFLVWSLRRQNYLHAIFPINSHKFYTILVQSIPICIFVKMRYDHCEIGYLSYAMHLSSIVFFSYCTQIWSILF